MENDENITSERDPAALESVEDYIQFPINCEPGSVYVVNDLQGQTMTRAAFVVEIVEGENVSRQNISRDVNIEHARFLRIEIPLTPSQRIGAIRNFSCTVEPGGIAAVPQESGESGKTYPWHVIWLHNSLLAP